MAHELPLRRTTPALWAERALAEPLHLLNDHAHLEKKAGTNALEMLHRWPETDPPEHWVQAITTLARDEVEHLAIVCRLLARRGGQLTKHHNNAYAKALRELVRTGEGADELVDRLLVGASRCVRVNALRSSVTRAWTRSLRSSIAISRSLTMGTTGSISISPATSESRGVDERWSDMLDAEAEIIAQQAPGSRIHSWEAG